MAITNPFSVSAYDEALWRERMRSESKQDRDAAMQHMKRVYSEHGRDIITGGMFDTFFGVTGELPSRPVLTGTGGGNLLLLLCD